MKDYKFVDDDIAGVTFIGRDYIELTESSHNVISIHLYRKDIIEMARHFKIKEDELGE